MGTAAAERERARTDIVRLVHRATGVSEFARAVTRVVRRVVPCDGTCLLTTDPATLLPTGEHVDNGLPRDATVRLTEIELGESDVNKFVALARSPRTAASLSAATEGELDRSRRQRELRRPSGFADELRAVCRDDHGTWGALTLLRAADRPLFSTPEVRFVDAVAPTIAEGLRRAALVDRTATSDTEDAGLVVVAPDGTTRLVNRTAAQWLDELGASGSEPLPVAVRAVAARARRVATGAPEGMARARLRSATGRWVTVRGSMLGAADAAENADVAVMLDAATAPELAPLIADAYGFTARERLVTELVARGASTNEIAAQLHLSPYTVQDHLKAIFEKSGTGSRRDLVARLFFDHYAPRLTDA